MSADILNGHVTIKKTKQGMGSEDNLSLRYQGRGSQAVERSWQLLTRDFFQSTDREPISWGSVRN